MLFSSFADTDPLCYPALLAHHVAAPVEPAVASFAACLLQDVVSAATAEAFTAVHALAGLIAYSALRPSRVRPGVPLTEVRRLFKVDKVVAVGPSAVGRVGMLHLPCVAVVGFDECGLVEAVLQQGTHQTELGGHLPTGLQLAAARRAVAFAFPSHVFNHNLQKNTHNSG